jgi:hypothetical protein
MISYNVITTPIPLPSEIENEIIMTDLTIYNVKSLDVALIWQQYSEYIDGLPTYIKKIGYDYPKPIFSFN